MLDWVKNSSSVFHSHWELFRQKLHVVLVRPENGGNVGSVARAMDNMGILGRLVLVGSPAIVTHEARKMAKHAGPRLEAACHVPDLTSALTLWNKALSLAATARVGSAHRPHPVQVRPAMERALARLKAEEVQEVVMVFGPESDGLTNDEVSQCDWVVSIPSHAAYRSLNLAQAVLVFCYEANLHLLEPSAPRRHARPSQRERLVRHFLQVAETAGFILPGDPFKMRPRLEEILMQLPPHMDGANTLHGLLDQISRSIARGGPDFKGRYKRRIEESDRDGKTRRTERAETANLQ